MLGVVLLEDKRLKMAQVDSVPVKTMCLALCKGRITTESYCL